MTAVTLGIATAFAAAWHVARHEGADLLLRHRLSGTPLANASYTIAHVGADRLVVTDVAVAGLGSLERAEFVWSPAALLDGRFETVILERARLQAVFGADGGLTGPTAGELAAIRQLGQGRDPFFNALRLDEIEIAAKGLPGAGRFLASAFLTRDGEDIVGEGTWRFSGVHGGAEGTLAVRHGRDDSHAVLTVGGGAFGVDRTRVDGLGGTLSLVRRAGETPAASLSVNLAGQTVTLAGHELGPARLDAASTGGVLRGTVKLGGPGSPFTADMTYRFARTGDAGWRIAARGAVAQTAALTLLPGLRVEAPASVETELEGRLPADLSWDRLDLEGRADIRAAGLVHAGKFRLGESRLGVAFARSGRSLTLTLDRQASLRSAAFATPPLPGLDRVHDIAMMPGGARLTVTTDSGVTTLVPDLTATVEAPGPVTGELRLAGSVSLGPGGALRSFALPKLTLSATGELAPGLAHGTVRVAGGIRGGPLAWQGHADIQGRLALLDVGPVSGSGVAIDLPLAFESSEGVTTAVTAPAALLRADSLRAGPATAEGLLMDVSASAGPVERGFQVRLMDTAWLDLQSLEHPAFGSLAPLSIRLDEERLPLFVVERLGDDLSWDLRLALGESPVRFALRDGGETLAVMDGKLPQVSIRLHRLGDSYLNCTVAAEGGDLVLEGPDLRVADLRGLVNYNSGLSVWPRINADLRRVEDLRSPARFKPVAMDLAISPVWPAGDDVRISGTLHMEGLRYLANVESSYRDEAGSLHAMLRVPPLRFEPAGLQPADVSPLHGAMFDEAAGSVEVYGHMAWTGGKSSADLSLLVSDFSVAGPGVRLEGLDGTIRFVDIDPWRTPPGQVLAARRLDMGLPLTGPVLALSLPGDGSLRLESVHARLAGGDVALVPQDLRFDRHADSVVLDARGVDPSQLLAAAGMAGVAANVKLNGHVPVTLDAGRVVVRGARLDAETPGILYHGAPTGVRAAAAGPPAVTGVAFQTLAVAIDSDAAGKLAVGLHLGASPEVPWGSGCRTARPDRPLLREAPGSLQASAPLAPIRCQ